MFPAINGAPSGDYFMLLHKHTTNLLQGINLHGDKDIPSGLIDSDFIYQATYVHLFNLMVAASFQYDPTINNNKEDGLWAMSECQMD